MSSPVQSSNNFDGIYIKGTSNISNKQSLLIIPIINFFKNTDNLLYLIQLLNGETFGYKKQESSSPISLRLIDWFVTNYSKKKIIMYNISNLKNNSSNDLETNKNSFENYFFVHDNYKSQLKECSKKHFDPFCRRNRIRFYYKPNAYFLTTVGQLNFFKWALENGVINYIRNNLADIENDMNNSIIDSNESYIIDKKKEKNTKKHIPLLLETTNTSNTSVNHILSELIPKTKIHRKVSCRQKRKELSSNSNKSFTKYKIPTTLIFD